MVVFDDRFQASGRAYRLLTAMLVCTVIASCASQSQPTAQPRVLARPGTVMTLLPFSKPEVEGTANDAGRVGLLGIALDAATGMYTYRFDDDDFKELRGVLLRTLDDLHVYDSVVDGGADVGGGVREGGHALNVDFSETGITEDRWGFSCTLKAKCSVIDANGVTVVTHDIAVTETSMVSVGKSKVAARSAFAAQVVDMLSAMP